MSNSAVDDLVFDVGAHKGEDSAFYLKLGFRVVAIEANPAMAKLLEARFRNEIDSGRFTLLNAAVSDGEPHVTFFVNRVLSIWGTTRQSWARRNQKAGAPSDAITVPGIHFGEVLRRYGCPHYLKIDIEGADMLCINALAGAQCRPKYLSIESTKTSWFGLLKEFATLESLGYSKFKVVDQRKHLAGVFVGQDGRHVRHSFETGASGPFGDALDGPWLTRRQAIRRYIPIFIMYKTMGDNTLLPKILSRVPFLKRALDHVSWFDTHAARD